MRRLSLRYSQFWPGFSAENSFFHRLLAREFEIEHVEDGDAWVDLEIVSVFPNRRDLISKKARGLLLRKFVSSSDQALRNTTDELPPRRASRRVWYTGENLRIPYGQDVDASLSYDQDAYGGTNAYFPLWYSHLNWFSAEEFNHRVGLNVRIEELMLPRPQIDLSARKLGCAFVGNTHPMRGRMTEHLSRWGQVDIYGRAVGRPVKFKADVSQEYKFMVCLENDLYPGYVTEKLLDAYVAGCVPLYWGDLGSERAINRKAFINLKDFGSLDEMVDYVVGLTNEEITEIYSQPFLSESPSLDAIQAVLRP